MSETLARREGQEDNNVLSIERWFPHSVAKVWRAITDSHEMGHWFPSRVEADLRPGGSIHFAFDQGDSGEGPAFEGTILEFEPLRVFAYTWADSTLRFELRTEPGPDGPGCRMFFSHIFHDIVSAASYAAGWHICFQNLYLFVDDTPADVGLDQWAALHDGFIDRFGLDAGSAEEWSDGSRVIRFDRQMTKSAAEVWAALTECSEPSVGVPVPLGFTNGAKGGVVAMVDAPNVLEFTSRGSRVRWELSSGNGGARLVLTDTVEDPHGRPEPDEARAAWADRLSHLAKRLREPGAGEQAN